MRQSEKGPSAGARRVGKENTHLEDSTIAAGVLVDGRARFLADATARAFAAGVKFALGRLAELAEADSETLRAYTRLLLAVNGGRR